MLSRDRARREASWDALETQYAAGERVEGIIFGRVKGGFTVDLGGAVAFLPGSQVDIRPVRDVGPLMDLPQPFMILKMDRRRGNIVVSRRAILEETRAEQRSGLILSLAAGQVIEGGGGCAAADCAPEVRAARKSCCPAVRTGFDGTGKMVSNPFNCNESGDTVGA